MAYFYNSQSVGFSHEMGLQVQLNYDYATKVYSSYQATYDGKVILAQMLNVPGTDIYCATSQSVLTGKPCFLATFSLSSSMNYVSFYAQK